MAKPKDQPNFQSTKREPKKRKPSVNFDNLRVRPHPAQVFLGLATDPDFSEPSNTAIHTQELLDSLIQRDKASSNIQLLDSHTISPTIHTQEPLDSQRQNSQDSSNTQLLDSQTNQFPTIQIIHKVDSPQETSMDSHPSFLDSNLARKTSNVVSNLASSEQEEKSSKPNVANQKKDYHNPSRAQLNVRINRGILSKIEETCFNYKLQKQDFIEQSAIHFMDYLDSQFSQNKDSLLAHDDLKINLSKTHDDIIMMYCDLTGNRWKASDDFEGQKYNKMDRQIIELGLLYTLLRAKRKVNSFKYFIPEIENMKDEIREAKLGEETIKVLLKRRREQWEELRSSTQHRRK
jgi:hypothetical protein